MDESSPHDAEFAAALRHFIEERGWTITEFCDPLQTISPSATAGGVGG